MVRPTNVSSSRVDIGVTPSPIVEARFEALSRLLFGILEYYQSFDW